MTDARSLTWNRTAILMTLVLLASIASGIWLIAQRVFLSLPVFQFTFYFYVLLGSMPALVTLAACARFRPTGSRARLILLALVNGVVFFIYLFLISPSFYSDIECHAESRSNLIVHQECICGWASSSDMSQVNCTSDRLIFSPLLRITEHR
jgi:hypothetical protein